LFPKKNSNFAKSSLSTGIVPTEINANLPTGVMSYGRTTKRTASTRLNNALFSLKKGAALMEIAAISYTGKKITFALQN
jgi:hypothetical protein